MKRALCLLMLVAACSHGSSKATPTSTPTPSEDASPTASASPSPSATASPTHAAAVGPVGTKVPAGFHPMSATFISDRTGWVLGASPCPGGNGSCDVIARTRDGGATWKAIPSPRTSPDHLAQIRFADERDGFVTGDQLWATHDAGATWKVVPGVGNVTELAAAHGWVWIAKNGLLKRAPVTGGPFRDEMEGDWFTLYGSHIAYTIGHEEFRLRVDDHGVDVPCDPDAAPTVALSSSRWLLVCEGDAGLGHAEKHAYESFDAGSTWKGAGDPPQLTGTDLYVTGDGDFVVDNQEVAVRRAGSWHVALSSGGGLSEGGFESASLGYAIGGFDSSSSQLMKVTHDAGRTWKTVAFSRVNG